MVIFDWRWEVIAEILKEDEGENASSIDSDIWKEIGDN